MLIKDIVLDSDHVSLIDGFTAFLSSDEKFFYIDGPGGAGKTTIVKYLTQVTLPEYNKTAELFGLEPRPEFWITAMHNKAAAVLTESGLEAKTVHSHLGLTLKFHKGNYQLVPVKDIKGSPRQVLFIDECSTTDHPIYNRLLLLPEAKIVLVGDRYQAPPVGLKESLIYANNPEVHPLKKIRRTEIPEMAAFFEDLREQVEYDETLELPVFKDIIVENTMEDAVKEVIDRSTTNDESFVVLGFTNSKTHKYNSKIRDLLGKPEDFEEGDLAIINSATKNEDGNTLLPTDTRVIVEEVSGEAEREFSGYHGDYEYLVRRIKVAPIGYGSSFTLLVMDPTHLSVALKETKKAKDWQAFYFFKEFIADLRHTHALTIHKSQGSSFDNVVIDLQDMKSCTDNSLARKLLYVAVSRARKKVHLVGELPQRIGETRYVPENFKIEE